MKHNADKLYHFSPEEDAGRREAEVLRETLRKGELPPPDILSPDRIVQLIEKEQDSGKSSGRRKWPLVLAASAAGLLLLLLPAGSFLFPADSSGALSRAEYAGGSPEPPMEESAAQATVNIRSTASVGGGHASPDSDNFSKCEENDSALGTVQLIPAARTQSLLEDGALLVDVRQPEEYKAGHIPQAVNLPLDTLAVDIAAYADTGRPLIVYCRTGVRSHAAAQELADIGYTVYDLGGIETDWPYATVTGN